MRIRNFVKWFTWHILPEEPLEIKSVIEIVVFALLFGLCYFLFLKWNEVAVREISIYSDAFDTENRSAYRDIEIRIPMTGHRQLIGINHSNVIISRGRKSDKGKVYAAHSYYVDSLHSAFCKEWNICENDPFSFDSISISILPYTTSPSGQFNRQIDIKATYFEGIIVTEVGRAEDKMYFRWCTSGDFSRFGGSSSDIKTRHDRWKFNIPFLLGKIFEPNSPLETPRWSSLEDISQAYYIVNLSTHGMVDSVALKIDFIGATEFSKMDPMPDGMDMSSIVFSDQEKVKQIKNRGLRFHAHFIEQNGRQQIRLFAVTAIMSGLLTVFIVFIIYSLVKLHRMAMGYIECRRAEKCKLAEEGENAIQDTSSLSPQDDGESMTPAE